MTNGGYIIVDANELVLDGVENTLSGISKKFTTIYKERKPIILTNLVLKKELTGLSADIVADASYGNLVIANDVFVLTTMIASMNINVNIDFTNDKYQGIKF